MEAIAEQPVRTSIVGDRHWGTWICAIGVIVATLVTYWPAMHAGYVWDDDAYVTHNKTLLTAEGLREIWLKPTATPQYYPIVHTTFWVEHHIWALWPRGYHAVNVLLHALNALLLWRIVARLGVPGARWIALIFALHPVGVESVAWITERKNVLSTLFYLLALDAYLRYWPPEEDQPPRPRVYWPAIGFFVLALLSKTVTCSLPVVLLLIVWWKRGRVSWRRIAGTLPMLALGAASGLYTVILERTHVGAEGAEWAMSPWGRIIIAGRAAWFYLGKVLWPHPLIFVYPRWNAQAHWPWQFAFPAAVVVTLVVLWAARNRIGRGPLALGLMFVVTLFPALGFFNIYPMRYSFVADHFQYMAQIAVIVAVVVLICRALSRRARMVVVTAVAAVLGCLTYQHAQAFTNSRALWNDTLSKNDRAWIAWHNLGAELREEGQTDRAIGMFHRVLELHPNDQKALNQLGVSYADKGEDDRAIEFFRKAMQVNANDYTTLINYATAAGRQGDLEGCEILSRRAIRLKPEEAAAYTLLGQALSRQGRTDEGKAALRKAVDVDPLSAMAHLNLAAQLADEGALDEAVRECRAAVAAEASFKPARQLLIRLLRYAGREEEARREEAASR